MPTGSLLLHHPCGGRRIGPWRNWYESIRNANSLLDNIEKATSLSPEKVKEGKKESSSVNPGINSLTNEKKGSDGSSSEEEDKNDIIDPKTLKELDVMKLDKNLITICEKFFLVHWEIQAGHVLLAKAKRYFETFRDVYSMKIDGNAGK